MAGDLFDVCVVGAGVEGSSAARYLASRGKNTLLLEQVKSLNLIIVAPNFSVSLNGSLIYSGAPNDGFFLNALKTLFRVSRELLDL